MILDITLKDGSNIHHDDVSYFDIRENEEMTAEGTYEVTGDYIYFERESDEIGKGTAIDSADIASYNLIDKENEREEAER